jgi:hypothetical protein
MAPSSKRASKEAIGSGFTAFYRLQFRCVGIDPTRKEQIKQAIQSLFPAWNEDEWWWAFYEGEQIPDGAIDGRSFTEETGNDEDDVPWMQRIAVAVWQANGGFCSFGFDEASVPSHDGHWEVEDYIRLLKQGGETRA